MERITFAASPYWAEVAQAVYQPMARDLMKEAAQASRDEHDLKKGRMEGADRLWASLQGLLKTWVREERARG